MIPVQRARDLGRAIAHWRPWRCATEALATDGMPAGTGPTTEDARPDLPDNGAPSNELNTQPDGHSSHQDGDRPRTRDSTPDDSGPGSGPGQQDGGRPNVRDSPTSTRKTASPAADVAASAAASAVRRSAG
ncbi:hypothetical protein [Nonomuraea insulae]|uniref:Uncharacterized protein n=1 Tax=Nonomuraea insulae TaxID=1616787 RepID=A0ABW1D550_9ACTN